MQPSQLIASLMRFGGPLSALNQRLLRERPDFAAALAGDEQALERLKLLVSGYGGQERASGRNQARVSVRHGASAREQAHAEVIAARLAAYAAAHEDFAFWRRVIGPAVTMKRLGAGTDENGPWQDVRLRCPHFWKKPQKLRLRREPLALEMRNDTPYAKVADDPVLREMLTLARRVAFPCGWSEAQGVRWLLTGAAPKPSPLTVRVMSAPAGSPFAEAATVTVMAQSSVVSHSRLVAALAKALKRRPGRPVNPSTATLVSWVRARPKETWPDRMSAWDRDRPPGSRRFADYRAMRRAYVRAIARRGR